MILSNDDLQSLRNLLDENSGLDEELLTRCSDLLHLGKYDEAVRNAFILLEERLKIAVNKDGTNMTGTQAVDYAFGSANGPLAKILGASEGERTGLRELFSGSFKLFRNPTAHGVVGYDSVEGRSIIGLVNLLLHILAKAGNLPPINTFPENTELALTDIEKTIGVAATSRLRRFLGRCIALGMKVDKEATQWIPFKRYALMKYDHWDKARPHQVTVFYLFLQGKERLLWFPVNQYYKLIIDFNIEPVQKGLKSAGFQYFGKFQDYTADLKTHNSDVFFDQVFDTVAQTCNELELRLQKHN